MRFYHVSTLCLSAVVVSPAVAQTSITSNGVRAGSTVIDSNGVHTTTADVGAHGVRTHGSALGGQTIQTNGKARSVDCEGRALTLEGNSNHLTLTRCSMIQIDGNFNVVTARFTETGRIALNGNRNSVNWTASPQAHVSVDDVGTKNSVVRR